jgi:molecular chaperone DnaK
MADSLSYTTEKSMKDAGDKLTADEKKPVEEAITELNKVKNGDDLEAIKKATETLSQAAQKIGEKLYKAAQEAQAASQPAGDAKPEGETPKDAEVDDSHSEASAKDEEKPAGEEKK